MLDEFIPDADLSKHREKYSLIKMPTEDEQFQFALNLIRSKQKSFMQEGLELFKSLFSKTKNEDIKRDSLYYMAIAETKLSNYVKFLVVSREMSTCVAILQAKTSGSKRRSK
jgi:hypothetical protein